MSPLSLRRFRAERILREEFDEQRTRVLATVRGRLAARGVTLAGPDLDACYGQAWQGLYAAMLAGNTIDNHGGWLVLVTYRRALDEHRAGVRNGRLGDNTDATDTAGLRDGGESDLAVTLDP